MVYRRPYSRRGGSRVRTTYDFTLDGKNFGGTKNTTDTVFEKEILDRAANLTPPMDIRNRINQYARKVINALEAEKTEKSLPNVAVERIKHVGSFVTDTCTHSSDKSDIVVELNSLPSFETMSELGEKVVENMKKADEKDTSVALAQSYGCSIMAHNCQVRILVTINASDSNKLEPDLHLEKLQLMKNSFAVGHTCWFLDLINSSPPDFVQEYQALVRVLKDVRARFIAFQNLSIWALQYLAFYSLSNGPNREKISLGTAFRRFFELIAAGLFVPKAPVLIDPTCPMRIGFDLTPAQMDALCISAQTVIRIFATGNDGYRAVLGTQGSAQDLTQATTTWKGVEIRPSIEAYKEGCMGIKYAPLRS
ncbi:unnamed protein product [Caenorhabditis sp. 36 PRJEB53466]|nr:unnamed protein product [Caenorhabditis sp. 36 PRJEB53466]